MVLTPSTFILRHRCRCQNSPRQHPEGNPYHSEEQTRRFTHLGQFYYENMQYKEAEPYLLRSSADQPKSATADRARQRAIAKRRNRVGSRKCPQSAFSPNPKTFAISHLIVAQALAGKGKDDEIAKECKEYLKEAPDSPLAPRVKDALAKLNSK